MKISIKELRQIISQIIEESNSDFMLDRMSKAIGMRISGVNQQSMDDMKKSYNKQYMPNLESFKEVVLNSTKNLPGFNLSKVSSEIERLHSEKYTVENAVKYIKNYLMIEYLKTKNNQKLIDYRKSLSPEQYKIELKKFDDAMDKNEDKFDDKIFSIIWKPLVKKFFDNGYYFKDTFKIFYYMSMNRKLDLLSYSMWNKLNKNPWSDYMGINPKY